MNIHVTERSTYKTCRRMHDYQYRRGLKPPNDSVNASWIGRGLHAALAGYYRGQDVFSSLQTWLDRKMTPEIRESLMPEESRKIDEMIHLMTQILLNYLPFAREHDNFDVVSVEQTLRVRVSGTYDYLLGTPDLLVRDRRTRKLWIYDHKSKTSFDNPLRLELDDQMTAYLWLVWQVYKEMPAGAIYNQLRKKIPAIPALVDRGKRLSKDKSIDTTAEKYQEAILAHGFNLEEYQDILTKLSDNHFFWREPIARNSAELNNFTQQLREECREMRSGATPRYPHSGEHCIYYCDYRILCKAQNESGDVQSLEKALFVYEPERRS